MRPVSAADIARALEERGIDPGQAVEIAALSRGAPAWAIAAAMDTILLQNRQAERDAADEWLQAGRYERLVTAFKLGEQFGKRRGEVIGIVLAAVEALRNRMIRAAAGDAAELPAETSTLALSRAVAASLQCLADLDANVRPRLALEAMVMRWPRLDPPLD